MMSRRFYVLNVDVRSCTYLEVLYFNSLSSSCTFLCIRLRFKVKLVQFTLHE